MENQINLNPKQVRFRKILDGLFTGLVYFFAVIAIIPLFLIVSTIFKEGMQAIHPTYETEAHLESGLPAEELSLQVNSGAHYLGEVDSLLGIRGDSIGYSAKSSDIFLIEPGIVQGNLKIDVIPDKRGEATVTVYALNNSDTVGRRDYSISVNGGVFYNISTFLTRPQPPHGESGGGVANALIGTVMLIFIASVIALPTGILGGLFLAEKGRTRMGEAVRLAMEVLQGTPSIVIGLIAYTLFVNPFGGYSALSGGIGLSIMMMPIVVRTTEETLKMLPGSLKSASYALGAPYYYTVITVLLPAAIDGIITAALVSIGRIAGETAPLLFTSFGNAFMSHNVFEPIAALPHLIYNYATSAYPESQILAWGASIVLILLVLALNISSRIVSKRIGMK
ncbi:MAG: phosphate ABC transporter permease PstA [Fibrobacterota bacterium]